MSKKKKILVFDLGNTTIHFGLFEGEKLVRDWRVETRKLFFTKKLGLPAKIDKVIGCSVVPALDRKLKQLIRPAPTFVTYKNIPEIKIATDRPAEVGADRLVNALAVYKKYRRDAIIVDLGTAITIDIISQDGTYQGGIIFPGINLCAEVLAQKTAKLPLIEMKKPKSVIGKNTIECIRSGLYYGTISMINCFVNRIKKIYKKDFLVVATGGDLNLFATDIPCVDILNKSLTLKGLLETAKNSIKKNPPR